MMDKMVCSKCGWAMDFKEGISKQNKPYKGYFCTNQQCKAVEWLPTEKKEAPSTELPKAQYPHKQYTPTPPPKEKTYTPKDELNTRLNACLIVAKDILLADREYNKEIIPKVVLDYANDLYRGAEEIKQGKYQK